MLTHDKSSHGLWPGELKRDDNIGDRMDHEKYFACKILFLFDVN
jgi:hypothetical protein